MKEEYVITFRKVQACCKHKTCGVDGYTMRTAHACGKKLTMDWVHSKDPARFIECREVNCPVLESCDILIK